MMHPIGAISPFVQTLIGAPLAVVGGVVSGVPVAGWQGRQSTRIARDIRRSERQEESLLELRAFIRQRQQVQAEALAQDPNDLILGVDFTRARSAIDSTMQAWDRYGGRVFDRRVREAVERARRTLGIEEPAHGGAELVGPITAMAEALAGIVTEIDKLI